MLGSYFDLKREIARIAAQRAAAETEKPADPPDYAYLDFDDRLQDFLQSFKGDSSESSAQPDRERASPN